MFKLFVLAAILAVAAAKPGIVGAPLAYTAGVAPVAYTAGVAPVAYSSAYSAPLVKTAYSAGYAAPVAAAYHAGYSGYPYAYSSGLVSPYVY